ncbi:hypothetical protein [Paenibacillus sp. PAMC21692]|uniref:hypothetical protein n=1 Tax=Paenibacillus sp. PAMC21692 TaxID=2762320 RepID=UPI00164D3C92|nr:hypothetical protein [Paenibacillus sp. PAMC21692]QNK57656.1 hypothetical protein H7F31_01385 [Paenibacillus sp. PAMC21692]
MYMLLRKLISSFAAGSACVLFFATAINNGTPDQFISTLGVVSFVAYPVVLMYGTIVSLALEYVTDKWVPHRAARIGLSAISHTFFGALFGWLTQLDPLAVWVVAIFAVTALLYFGVDMLLRIAERKSWRRLAIIVMVAMPALAVVGFAVVFS